jgi:hypothetical protein
LKTFRRAQPAERNETARGEFVAWAEAQPHASKLARMTTNAKGRGAISTRIDIAVVDRDCDEMTPLGAKASKRTVAAAKRRRRRRSFRDMRAHARLATRNRYRPTRNDAERRRTWPDRGLDLKNLG